MGVSQEAPVTQSRLFSVTFFFHPFFVATDRKERVLKIPPSFLPVSVSSPSVAIATEPHLHTELIQLVVCVCVRELLVPVCVCVSVGRLTSVEHWEGFQSGFLVDLKWGGGGGGASAGLAVKRIRHQEASRRRPPEACAAVSQTDRSPSQWQPSLRAGPEGISSLARL